MMTRIALWVALTVSASLANGLAAASTRTLEQEVAHTISSNPLIMREFNQLQSRNQEIREAYSGYQPSLDLDAGAGYQKIDNDTNKLTGNDEYDPWDVSLTLRQFLFQGFEISENVNRTRAEAEAQRFKLLSDAEDLALRVAEVYLALLRTEQIYRLSRGNRDRHQQIYHDINRRTEQGIGTSADLSQISARLAQANSNLLAAENNWQDAKEEYLRVVNQLPSGQIRPEVDANYLPSTLDEAIGTARATNPTIKLASADIDAASAEREVAKSNFYPELYLDVKQTWEEETGGRLGDQEDFSVMLRLRFNLFNGFANHAEVKRLAYQMAVAKDIRDDSIRQLDEGTRLAWNAWQFTHRQLGYLQGHVEAAHQTAQAYTKQFDIGKRTLLDLLNTENELFDARVAYLDAEYAEIEAKYRVLNASGVLLDALRVTVPEPWQQSRR
ncbi:TolC family outer membrane protein [uncultured Ferrimonas sp.]|uniref:TolC family outer membrane protein n=1 Tax=uncultured Ferrimonas sp. TaxID=432640 RepID=UPI00262E3399|nr:TolC family outer membrane protein [uncultured Ferrimonas sp.]